MKARPPVALAILWICSVQPSYGQETRFEPRFSVISPYMLEPSRGWGDTAVGAGIGIQVGTPFLIFQDISVGVVGHHAVRYELMPTFRILPYRTFSPEIGVGGALLIRPEIDGGIVGRIGLTWDTSRALNMWSLRLTADTGASVFFRRPRTLEWQIVRVSVAYPF